MKSLEQQKEMQEANYRTGLRELQGSIQEKERSHCAVVKQKEKEVNDLKVDKERVENLLQESKEVLEEDFMFLLDLIKGNPRLITGTNSHNNCSVYSLFHFTENTEEHNRWVRFLCQSFHAPHAPSEQEDGKKTLFFKLVFSGLRHIAVLRWSAGLA